MSECENNVIYRKIGRNVCGFTLIELMLVIGILLVLSAIALPNIQEAHTRAKFSRVKNDLRVMSGAIDIYYIDHNNLARMRNYDMYKDPSIDILFGREVNALLSPCLSTPVAYMTNSLLIDPFMANQKLSPVDQQLYTYQPIDVYISKNPDSTFWPPAKEFYGSYRIGSVGPDLRFGHGFANSAQLIYDPSNGSLSLGNIWRSQKQSESSMPSNSLLIGTPSN